MRKTLIFTITALFLLAFSACTYLPAKSSAEAFSFQELTHVFALTESEIFDTYGEPDSEKPASFLGLNANEFHYGKNTFCTEAASGYVYYVRLADDALAAPRSIKTGMKLREIVPLFASDGDDALHTSPSGEQYRLLYGTYASGGDYGVIFYDGRTPTCIEYSSEGCVFTVGIQHGKASYLEYSVE